MNKNFKANMLIALTDWIEAFGQAPHVYVDASKGCPAGLEGYVKDGILVLNLSTNACRNMSFGETEVSFDARFGGAARHVVINYDWIKGVYNPFAGIIHPLDLVVAYFANDDIGVVQMNTSITNPSANVVAQATETTPMEQNHLPRPTGGHLKVVK